MVDVYIYIIAAAANVFTFGAGESSNTAYANGAGFHFWNPWSEQNK